MRRTLLFISELLLLLIIKVHPAFAQITIAVKTPETVISPSVPLGQIIGFLIGAAVVIGIILALIFVVLGGIQWITSGGDKGKVEAARNHIVAALIGIIIIVLTVVIVNFLLQLLGIGDLTNLKVPTLPKVTPTPTP